MTHAPKLFTISAALVAAITLSACNNRNEENAGQTVGQGVPAANSGSKDANDSSKGTSANVGAAVSDATITTKINAALIADDQLKALKIDVDTKDGKVVLTGAAPDAASLERATTMAKSVEGVVDVENRLTVQPKG